MRTLVASLSTMILFAAIGTSPVSGFQDKAEKAQDQQDGPKSDTKKSNAKQKEKKPKRKTTYDESVDAKTQLETALAKAKKENRRVLIQWGANWCGWCHLLHDLMAKDAKIRRKLMYEYDVVLIDVGRMDKNQDLVKRFEADLKGEGLPFLTVLDADGKVVVNQETASLESDEEDVKGHVPEKVLAFLTEHESEPWDAETILESGIARAKQENKLVFLHFGAPWCGWCHYLEDWMAEPEIHKLLAREFVDVKIDTDRMKNGQETLKKFREKRGGIPWFVFLDGSGEALVSSTGPDGNVGFPSTDEEIGYFVKMLEQTQRFEESEIEFLRKSLVKNREQREQRRKAAAKPGK